jgi:hypothetical protein
MAEACGDLFCCWRLRCRWCVVVFLLCAFYVFLLRCFCSCAEVFYAFLLALCLFLSFFNLLLLWLLACCLLVCALLRAIARMLVRIFLLIIERKYLVWVGFSSCAFCLVFY